MNERQITLITLAFLALFIIGGGVGVWYLQFNVLSKKKDDLKGMEDKLATARKKNKELKKLISEVSDLKKTEAEEIQRIPNLDDNEYDGFVDQLNQMRRQSGVFLSQARIAKAARGGRGKADKKLPADVDKISYELTIRGNFYPLLRFINLIETSKRHVEIDNATIAGTRSRRGTASTERSLKIKVTTYAFKVSGDTKKESDDPKEGTQVIDSTPIPTGN